MSDSILLFYNGRRLVLLTGFCGAHHLFRTPDAFLAETHAGNVRLMALNAQHPPLLTDSGHAQLPFAFTPFGHAHLGHSLDTGHVGFTGERLDKASGCYVLGAGYRYYSPVLMRFQQCDSLSPFGEGGINQYSYCLNDPVNRTDPSGRSPRPLRWFNSLFHRRDATRQEFAGTSRAPANPTGAHAMNDSSLSLEHNRPHPPSYFEAMEGPPPPYVPSSRQNTWAGAPAYREYPSRAEQLLEFQGDRLLEVKSLLAYRDALQRSRDSSLPVLAQSAAISTLKSFAKDRRPLQTDNGILDAVRTASQVYDVRNGRR
jgi:RHS repeat-associated protein